MKYFYDFGEFNIEVGSRIKKETQVLQDYIIYYIIRGSLSIKVVDKTFEMEESDIFLSNYQTKISLDADENCVLAKISFSKELVKKYFGEEHISFLYNSKLIGFQSGNEIKRTVEEILDYAINLPKGKQDIKITVMFYQILENLFAKYIIADSFVNMDSGYEEQKNQIVKYIEQNYKSEVNLEKIAIELNLTYFYLSRNFKNMFGVGFYEYLNRVRLKHAIEDLIYSEKNITEVALDNGYSSSSVFNRLFKSSFNMSPKEYKKKAKENYKIVSEIDLRSRYIGKKSLDEKVKEETDVINYELDSKTRAINKKPFNKMINGGYSSDLLYSNIQDHLKYVCEEIGFQYVRIWNIFCEEIELRINHDVENLNFSKIDIILDFMVRSHIKPWIDFGDKPKNIVNEVNREAVIKQNKLGKPIFKSKVEFETLLDRFIKHVIYRYGIEEVSGWIYEFWNDYYRPERQNGGEKVSFFEAFDIAYKTIKKYLPEALVGGSGMILQNLDDKFLSDWAEHQHPDFISTIFFPYGDPMADNVEYEPTVNLLQESLKSATNKISKSGLKSKLYVCEFSSNVSSRNYQNDSCLQAAYVLANAGKVRDVSEVVGYWCASDIYSESWDTKAPVFGGSGILTKDGITKPVYYSFEFLSRLEKYIIDIRDSFVFSFDGMYKFSAVFNNYQSKDYGYYLQNGVQWNAKKHIGLEVERKKIIKIELNNVEEGVYKCSFTRMGPGKGSLLEEWNNLDFCENFSEREFYSFKNCCKPKLSIKYIETKMEKLEIDIQLDVQEIVLLNLEKIFK